MKALTDEQVSDIKWFLQNTTLKQADLAALFNITYHTISKIKNNKFHKDIDAKIPIVNKEGFIIIGSMQNILEESFQNIPLYIETKYLNKY